jgi:hypothetical protein
MNQEAQVRPLSCYNMLQHYSQVEDDQDKY